MIDILWGEEGSVANMAHIFVVTIGERIRSASSITRDSKDDDDNALDCNRASARDGVAIMMSGLSDSSILFKEAF